MGNQDSKSSLVQTLSRLCGRACVTQEQGKGRDDLLDGILLLTLSLGDRMRSREEQQNLGVSMLMEYICLCTIHAP